MKSAREQPVIRIVKKVRKGHGHHGGAWKVAFADFMTSMMALFLVLWLITQSSEVRVAIAGYFQDPMGRSNAFGNSLIDGAGEPIGPSDPTMQPPKTSGARAQLLQLQQQIQSAIASSPELNDLERHVLMEMTPEGLRISLLEDSNDVFFRSGGARPLPQAERLFHAIGALLGRATLPVVIEGHTDARQYPPDASYDNWNLSSDRAETSRRLLMTGGLSLPQVTGMRGFADTDLLHPDRPLAPQNRRVTILVVSPLDPPPTAPRNDLLIGSDRTSPRP